MKLVPASLAAPAGLDAFLRELGDGENGFVGLPSLPPVPELLQELVDMAAGRNLRAGWVPMTTYWLLDDAGELLGISRLRHRLTDFLLGYGGHIGYYLRPAARGKGNGTRLLALTLEQARELGLERVLLTADADNVASIRVISKNGGVQEDQRVDEHGVRYGRFWIELMSQ